MPELDSLSASQKSSQPAAQENFEVHTLPQKFLSLRPAGARPDSAHQKRKPTVSGFKKNLIIGVVIVLFVGGAMALAAWLFVKSIRQPEAQQAPVAQAPLAAESGQAQNLNNRPAEENGSSAEATSSPAEILNFDNWQTIKNDKYFYTFQAPSVWQQASVVSGSNVNGRLEEFSLKDKQGQVKFSLVIFDNVHQLDLKDWLLNVQHLSDAQLQAFTLYNQPAYKVVDKNKSDYVIYSLYGPYIYALSFKNNAPSDNDMKAVNNHLLISFKFLPLKDGAGGRADNSGQSTTAETNIKFTPAIDSDHDGLTDVEEKLYGTDKTKRDTDADGYIDGDEVANLYDPLRPGSAKLYASSSVKTYLNKEYNYNLLYPAAWQVKSENDDSVIFQDKDGEFVQVLVVPDKKHYSDILDWYKANVNLDTSQLTKFNIDGIKAVRTPDGYKVYFLYHGRLYSLIYNIGLRQDANFMVTFDMMIKSLSLMEAS